MRVPARKSNMGCIHLVTTGPNADMWPQAYKFHSEGSDAVPQKHVAPLDRATSVLFAYMTPRVYGHRYVKRTKTERNLMVDDIRSS